MKGRRICLYSVSEMIGALVLNFLGLVWGLERGEGVCCYNGPGSMKPPPGAMFLNAAGLLGEANVEGRTGDLWSEKLAFTCDSSVCLP